MNLWNESQHQSMREFLLGYGFKLTHDNIDADGCISEDDDWNEECYSFKLQGGRKILEINLYSHEFDTPFGSDMLVDLSKDVGDSISIIKEVIDIHNRLENLGIHN